MAITTIRTLEKDRKANHSQDWRKLLARANRERKSRTDRRGPSAYDRARDELFSAIRQCGVMDADESDQNDWMQETIQYMKQRYPELSDTELRQLQDTGSRFCQPVIPHGKEHTALSTEGANAA